MKGKKAGFLARLGAYIGLTFFALGAHAEYVQCETPFSQGIPLQSIARAAEGGLPNLTQVVWGSSLSVTSFNLTSAGQLSVDLKSIDWPNPLTELTLLVTDMNDVWERLDISSGVNNLLVNVGAPGQFFAAVFARTENRFTPGLYHLEASFAAPVPLPAAAWLLLSGLGGLAATMGRRKR